MNDGPRKGSRAWISWALLAVSVLYPSSEAPAWWFDLNHGGESMTDALNTLYAPVQWCAAKSSVTEDAHDSYIHFWLTR